MLLRTGALGGARFAVSDRFGGVSAPPYDELNLGDHVGDDQADVAENRRRLAAGLGLEPASLCFMQQVHGREVRVVERLPAAGGTHPPSDALVSALPGAALVVLVADCVPVLLAAPAGGRTVLAAVHAGRRGVQDGVVPAAVAAMTDLGARAEESAALVGPAVCGGCYEVPAELAEEVVAVAPAARATTRTGTPSLDLAAAVAEQLASAGVSDVTRVDVCTQEEPALFSHRRNPVSGRIAAVVWSDDR